MIATVYSVAGLIVGTVLVLLLGRGFHRGGERPAKPTPLSWAGLVLGALAVLAVGLGFLKLDVPALGTTSSMAFAFAGLVVSVSALVKGDRHWPAWLALVLCAAPALFWLAFFVLEIVTPHG
jgi:hypothetical protein